MCRSADIVAICSSAAVSVKDAVYGAQGSRE